MRKLLSFLIPWALLALRGSLDAPAPAAPPAPPVDLAPWPEARGEARPSPTGGEQLGLGLQLSLKRQLQAERGPGPEGSVWKLAVSDLRIREARPVVAGREPPRAPAWSRTPGDDVELRFLTPGGAVSAWGRSSLRTRETPSSSPPRPLTELERLTAQLPEGSGRPGVDLPSAPLFVPAGARALEVRLGGALYTTLRPAPRPPRILGLRAVHRSAADGHPQLEATWELAPGTLEHPHWTSFTAIHSSGERIPLGTDRWVRRHGDRVHWLRRGTCWDFFRNHDPGRCAAGVVAVELVLTDGFRRDVLRVSVEGSPGEEGPLPVD